ncbi:hypothetical protein LIV57_13940 [Chryseobacterium sp. X308]|uniref:hypothetical protein n=1 Tax=Chryseobacterium sp. X308 TaxID=2884873 RepID=UPI001D157FFE|nr:hypothetical protein [Chryseobacterium sp. X308]MCC3216368.1 hypothetical protein [Chryseobacterium sp. X308]
MKKNLLLAGLLTTFSLVAKSQVGINTSNPQGIFNIDGLKNNPTTGVPTAAQATDDLVVTSNGNLGLGLIAPGTTLDVNGAITNRETALAVAGNAVTIPANVSQVQLTGAATATVTITAPVAPNAGQRIIVYNNTTGGFGASLGGVTIPNGKALEYVYSNSGWRATDGGAVGGSSGNIYTTDGTLTGNRTVTQGANTLTFTGTQTNAFSVDGNTLSVDAANNRIGVGTTTPTNKLVVAGTNAQPSALGTANTNATFRVDGDSSHALDFGTYTNNPYGSYISSQNKTAATPLPLVLNPAGGNVGIGIDNPSTKLHVQGSELLNAAVTTAQTKNALDINVGQDGFSYGNRAENFGINMRSSSSAGTGSISRINFGDISTTTATGNRYLSFSVGQTPNELMYLTDANSGRVGIGTVSPTNKLVVAGINAQPSALGTANTNATFRIDGNTSHALDFGTYTSAPFGSYISSQNKTGTTGLPLVLNPVGGNVGVGTNAPDNSALLDLTATNRGFLLPRVSLTSMTDGTTIPSPAKGLMVYNSNTALTPYGEGIYSNSGTPAAPRWDKLAPQKSDFVLSQVVAVAATAPVDQGAAGVGNVIDTVNLGLSSTVVVPANSTAKILMTYTVPMGTYPLNNSNTVVNGYFGIRFLRNGVEAPEGSRKYSVPYSDSGSHMMSVSGSFSETVVNSGSSPINIVYSLNGYVEGTVSTTRFNMWASSGDNFNWGKGSLSGTVFAKDN